MNFLTLFINRLYSTLQGFGIELDPQQYEELKEQITNLYDKYFPERFRKFYILIPLAFLIPWIVNKLVTWIMEKYVDTDADGEPDPDEVLEALGRLLKKDKQPIQ